VQNQIDALLEESDGWKARAEQAQRVESGVTFFEQPAVPTVPLGGDVPPETMGAGTGNPEIDAITTNAEYKEAFDRYTRGGIQRLNGRQIEALQRGYVEMDEKTLSGNTGATGGFLITPDFRAELVEERAARAFLRNLVDVQSCSGDFREAPVVNAPSSNAGIYANGIVWTWVNSPTSEDTGETDPEIGLMRIPIHDAVAKTRLGVNMVNDAAVNIASALPRWYGESWALQEDYVILRGNGTGQPLGILSDTDITGTHYVESTVSGSLKSDDLISLVYDLEAQYAANARWVTSRANLKTVRQFKDGEGRYIWQPGLQAGEPDTLMGYEVAQSPWIPAISAGNYSFIFGDLKYYAAHVRIGGQAKVARAFRVLKIKA